jgi:hypothetical protein
LALKGLWRKFSWDWTRWWDFGDSGAALLIIGILLRGILSKPNQAGWAMVSVIVLCCFFAGLHCRPRSLISPAETAAIHSSFLLAQRETLAEFGRDQYVVAASHERF